MDVDKPVEHAQAGGRRGSDLSIEQHLAIANAIVAFSEFARDESVVVSRLLILIDTCRALLSRSDFTVTLRDDEGSLHLIGTTSESARLIEARQRILSDGPLLEAMQLTEGMLKVEMTRAVERWPTLFDDGRIGDYTTLFVVPLRAGTSAVGALSVYERDTEGSSDLQMEWVGALASSAALSFHSERAQDQLEELGVQLQRGLNGRIVVDEAGGIVAEARGIELREAIELLRSHSREHGSSIISVAQDIIERHLSPFDLGLGTAGSSRSDG